MNHTPDWINVVAQEIVEQEFELKIFQMSLHGVGKDELTRIRTEFEGRLADKEEDVRIPIEQFERLGLSFGKANTTKVIRGK